MNLIMKNEIDEGKKGSANRLKSLEPVKHIKLLFTMFRKIFNNTLMGLKTRFLEFKNKKQE